MTGQAGEREAVSAHTITNGTGRSTTYTPAILEREDREKKYAKMSRVERKLADLHDDDARVRQYYLFATTMGEDWIGGGSVTRKPYSRGRRHPQLGQFGGRHPQTLQSGPPITSSVTAESITRNWDGNPTIRRTMAKTVLFYGVHSTVKQELMTITTKLIVLGLAMVLVAGTLGFDWADTLFRSAEAHGVQADLLSRFVRIEDETFNTQSMQTGEILTVQGQVVSLVERDLRAWVSIFFESESENIRDRWEVVNRDPPGGVFDIPGNYPPYTAPLDNSDPLGGVFDFLPWQEPATSLILDNSDPPGGVFDIPGNSVVPYTVSARALHEGVYHVHTQLIVKAVGPGLGPGATVVVEGEPIARPGGTSEDLFLIIVAGVILGGIAAAFVIKARSGGGGVPRQHLHAYTHTIWDTLRTIGGVMVRPTRTFEHIRDFDHYYLPRAACVTATVLILGTVEGAKSLSALVGTVRLGVPLPALMGLGVLVEVCFLTLAWYVGKRMGGNANWRKVFAVLMYTNAVLLAPVVLDVFDVYVGISFGAVAVTTIFGVFGVWYIIIIVFAMRSVNMFGTWRALKAIILVSLPIMALIVAVTVLVVMWQLSRPFICCS